MRRCETEGCHQKHLARGMCSAHYHAAHKAEMRTRECTIAGCDRPMYETGMCQSHYWRRLKYGDPFAGETSKGESMRWLHATLDRLVTEPTDECVPHPFPPAPYGYTEVTVDGERMWMHAAVLLFTGRTPPRRTGHTRHLCGNGWCVNPQHIAVGTAKENSDDKERHGRVPRGERHPNTRLSDADIAVIRSSEKTQVTLAKEFGVTQGYVSQVRHGKRRAAHQVPFGVPSDACTAK